MSLLQIKEKPDIKHKSRNRSSWGACVHQRKHRYIIPQFLETVLQSQDGPLRRRGHGYQETSWDVVSGAKRDEH